MLGVMSETQRPVWVTFPKIPWGSIGWRMGAGEDYWHAWVSWFKAQPVEARESYKEAWPEPEGWKSFYAFIETGAVPPWVSEQQCLVAEAAIPPTPEESVITGYHRMLWLIRHHFKRVRIDTLREDESLAEIHVAPDGSEWRLSASATRGGMHFTRVAK